MRGRDPVRGRRVDRGRGAEQQVTLQHARAHERPHGRGQEGRRRGRRARPSQSAVRLFGSPAHRAEAGRHRATAEPRRRGRHLRLDQSRRTASRSTAACSACVLDFPYLGQRVGVPARVSAEPLQTDVPLTTARRARGRDRRHLHELGQDRRRVRDREPVPAQRTSSSTRSSRPASRCAATSSRWRTRARGTSRCSRISGSCATTSKNAPALTRSLLNELGEQKPDAIVFELGDGLLGAYGVEAILRDKEICQLDHGAWCCARTIRSAPGAARSCCARSSASSRP